MSKNGNFDLSTPLEEYDDRDKFDFDENELDAFNEETFGGGGLESTDEFDWESEHDKLIEIDGQGTGTGKDKNKTLEAFDEEEIDDDELDRHLKELNLNNNHPQAPQVAPNHAEKAKIPISLNNLFATSAQSPAANSTVKQPMPSQCSPVPIAGAGKIRTLEDIENELLQSSPAKPSAQAPPPGSFQPPNLQQQQMELAKLLPFLNMQQQQQHQLQAGNLMEQQASSLSNEATIQPQQQQQQQPQMNQNDINLILLQQQQQLIQRYTINQILTSNVLSPQEKQAILAQMQKNLQANLLQQQILQQRQQIIQIQQHQQQMAVQQEQQSRLLVNEQHQRLQQDQHRHSIHNNANNGFVQNNSNNRGHNNNNNKSFDDNNRSGNNNQRRNQFNGGDKLTGAMTDKEKNWVVNVQMLQLQVDDSYKKDFYYTAWMKKKEKFEQNSNVSQLKTSTVPGLSHINKHDPKNYKPVAFENSLGRVTASNFHHPRALIELSKPSHEDVDDKHKDKNICTILLEIEKIYEVYLDIDEIEHHILQAHEDQRLTLFQERRAKVDKLLTMLCSDNFAHYLFVAKGKRLVGKCLQMFNSTQNKVLLAYLMQYIYVISKNNITVDEIYSQICVAIDQQKFTDLVDIVNQFVKLYSQQPAQVFNIIFLNKFALSFLLKFFSKSELVSQDDYDDEVKTIWSMYLNLILSALYNITQFISTNSATYSNLRLQVHEVYYLNVKVIFEEFQLNRELWLANEQKLKEFFSIAFN